MVVEDEPDVRAITADMARTLGHVVFEAANADAALHLLSALSINTLITDIGLPGMSGDVFAALARSVRPQLGIVFATGNPRLRNLAADGTNTVVLCKPYGSAELADALATVSAANGAG